MPGASAEEAPPLGHGAFALASTAGMIGWTALVHFDPPRFFLIATGVCLGWLALSAGAMGPRLRSRLAPGPMGAVWGVALGLFLYLASRAFLWAFCGGFSTALCGELTSVYTRFSDGRSVGGALALAIVIAPAEELYWRGVVLNRLRPRLGRWGAVAAATLLSSLVLLLAGEPLLALAALPTSAFWGVLTELRRSLFPSTLSHGLWDLLIVVLAPAH